MATHYHLHVSWATSEDEVREAQRLRYDVFAKEMHARLNVPPGTPAGLDVDWYDAYCDHLLVRAVPAGGELHDGALIGTYRVLGPAQAKAAGGYYSDTEFDLEPLAPLRPTALELGRSCVHAAWRRGGVVLAMWGALAVYMQERGLETMIGCASISAVDGGRSAARIWRRLRESYLAESRWRVRPRTRLQAEDSGAGQHGEDDDRPLEAPPLIKGYLRCGAQLLGPPAFDAAFNTADLPMMLRFADLAPRYRKHLLGGG